MTHDTGFRTAPCGCLRFMDARVEMCAYHWQKSAERERTKTMTEKVKPPRESKDAKLKELLDECLEMLMRCHSQLDGFGREGSSCGCSACGMHYGHHDYCRDKSLDNELSQLIEKMENNRGRD